MAYASPSSGFFVLYGLVLSCLAAIALPSAHVVVGQFGDEASGALVDGELPEVVGVQPPMETTAEEDVALGDPVFIDTMTHMATMMAPEPASGDDDGEFELATARGRWGRRWGGRGWGYGGYGGVSSTTNIITMPAPPPPPPAPPAMIVSAAYQTAAAQQMQTLTAQQQGVAAASTAAAARNCEWGPWSAWGSCSGAPGQEGLRYRSRVKLVQESNGGTCAGTAEQAQRCISGTRTL